MTVSRQDEAPASAQGPPGCVLGFARALESRYCNAHTVPPSGPLYTSFASASGGADRFKRPRPPRWMMRAPVAKPQYACSMPGWRLAEASADQTKIAASGATVQVWWRSTRLD